MMAKEPAYRATIDRRIAPGDPGGGQERSLADAVRFASSPGTRRDREICGAPLAARAGDPPAPQPRRSRWSDATEWLMLTNK